MVILKNLVITYSLWSIQDKAYGTRLGISISLELPNNIHSKGVFMNRKETMASTTLTSISYADAKKTVESMNLIDGFLFDCSIEDEEDAKIVIGSILSTVFDRKIKELQITSQKNFQAIDTKYHGIRLDAHVKEDDGEQISVKIYDVEMENRIADKPELPRRLRFYNSLMDSRFLESGADYQELPDFVSITILSYDPFDAGDMYYEASTHLSTHPSIKYDDGLSHIYLYCGGRINSKLNKELKSPISVAHGKRLQEMLKYILAGEKTNPSNSEVNNLDTVVSKIKKRPEVTKKYMQQWDRERILIRETREETKEETQKEDALEIILFGREYGVSDEKIRKRLNTRLKLERSVIDELFKQADSEATVNNS